MKLIDLKLNEYLDILLSDAPAPGGGSVSALPGAQGAALLAMVCDLTTSKEKYASVHEHCSQIRERSGELYEAFAKAIDEDTDAFNLVSAAFKMPKDYTPKVLAEEFKKFDPSLDISGIEDEMAEKTEKGEIIFVQIALSILSGFIFGFIWLAFLFRTIKKDISGKGNTLVRWLLSALVPFAGIFIMLKLRKELLSVAADKGVKVTLPAWLLVCVSVIFPILPINLVALSLIQHAVNKIYAAE
jgi:hypothetical protein